MQSSDFVTLSPPQVAVNPGTKIIFVSPTTILLSSTSSDEVLVLRHTGKFVRVFAKVRGAGEGGGGSFDRKQHSDSPPRSSHDEYTRTTI